MLTLPGNGLVPKRLGPKRLGGKTSRGQTGLGSKRPVTFNPSTPDVLSWDIGKHNNPRCDVTKSGVPSGTILFAYI